VVAGLRGMVLLDMGTYLFLAARQNAAMGGGGGCCCCRATDYRAFACVADWRGVLSAASPVVDKSSQGHCRALVMRGDSRYASRVPAQYSCF